MNLIKRFLKDEQGLETLEYAIILGIIVVACIATIGFIGGWVNNTFNDLWTELQNH